MRDENTNPGSFDARALRQRYHTERARRLRPDGNEQYLEISGRFTRYREDPWVEPLSRGPLHDEVDAVVLGGGFGGLLVAARLRQAGLGRVRIIEKAGDFGGTWYWNRYPGAQCDVESYIYLPLLEEIGYVPTEKYAHAPEILAYAQRLGREFDLYRDACFQTEVVEARWDEPAARWIVHTDRGDRIRARYLCMASGPLNRPKLPGVLGIEEFTGHSFHTSRWDYAYTGGDSKGGLTRLEDKRIGLIGTGATAVQVVPHLGVWSKELFVFQRTPSSVDVRGNRPTDAAWAAGLEPGWQRRRMENFNKLFLGRPESEDLVSDSWTDLTRRLFRRFREADHNLSAAELAEMMEIADFEKMEEIRARVQGIVADPATAEALKPWYRQFCKRPCFHDAYLQTFNRPNVTLVDTQGHGVERITRQGVVATGREYELDCLIYATGFEVGTAYTRRANCEVHGRAGLALSEHWARGVRTFHSFHTHGFPNLFIVSNIQGGLCANYTHTLDECSRHIGWIVSRAEQAGFRTIEAAAEAEAKWVQAIVDHFGRWKKFQQDCTPGYYNNEGKLDGMNPQDIHHCAGSDVFFEILAQWREKGDLSGIEVTPAERRPVTRRALTL